jgi:glycosyltransferase involved in cell wall biosynthesis|tara:strand:- start:26339 stop:27046 length:708 start_codon:yes stop_codon:yes gene_type:complete
MLSIVVPTLNEEKYLPRLLDSIKKQEFRDYEIVVSDADSEDKTRQIAKKYGCRIVKGGFHARGVNNGIKAAKGDIVLVLDADAVLPDSFLTDNYNTFREKNLDLGSCLIKSVGGNLFDKIAHVFANAYYFSFEKIKPFVPSFCFFVRKKFFFNVGSFDEKIPWLVDLAFSNSLPKKTRYSLLPVHVKLSVRMAERLGRFRQARIMFLGAVLRTIGKNYYGRYEWKGKAKTLQRVV